MFEICILNSFWDMAIWILGFWDQISSKMAAMKFNTVFKLKYLKKKLVVDYDIDIQWRH